MVTIRTSAEIPQDRRLVLILPPDTPLGEADLVITVAPKSGVPIDKSASEFFGAVRGGDATAADNDRIDRDLNQAYGKNNI